MNKIFKYRFFIVFVLGLVACGDNDNTDPKKLKVNDVNPNGSSELAILMRLAFADAEIIKTSIEQGDFEYNKALLEKIEKFHSAEPTEDDMKPASFNGFTIALQESIRQLKNSSQPEAKEFYNQMVERCLNCHQEICPGPMVRIKKLRIN